MKKYISPSINVVTIKANNILTQHSVNNEVSSASQLSRSARFSDFYEEEE